MTTKVVLVAMLAAAGMWFGMARSAKAGEDTLKIGSPAPDFSRQTADGKTFSLKDLQGKRAVVLFFYPKDETSVCTKEACTFRDSYQKFQELGAEVVGVSGDDKESHEHFAANHHLQYQLISDSDGSLRKLYRVQNSMGLIPGRVTFVIDKEGTIRMIFNNMMDGPRHVKEALDTLQSINSGR